MNYDVLFTPFKIGRMEVKNRIVMSPMGTLMANRDGTFSENEIAYYEERARGGTGMIICGQGYLNSDFGQGVLGHAWDHYHVVPAARGLTERLHGYGCKAVMQLLLHLHTRHILPRFLHRAQRLDGAPTRAAGPHLQQPGLHPVDDTPYEQLV